MKARDCSLDIAVTGISARFPGSPDLGRWWTALTEGRVLTTRYDRSTLHAAGVPASLLDDPDYVPVRGHLADSDRFDNTLFQINPRDAEMMDPQHRLMLEAAWSAMEDAASPPRGACPTTAVYASGSGSGYLRRMLGRGELDPLTLDQALHGTEPDFIASLISYKLGLTGPAIGVQTACSSSLVGVHLAIQALLCGDCDQALVVGAGIDFPQAGHLHVPGGIQSASGRCRPFDEGADGVVAGSGVVCVVLRRLADATGGPRPYGVILGSAINNDGASKAGYYAPSGGGQEAVIRSALRTADVDASSIGYLEAHATGTRVGDPIEWAAASAALGGLGGRPGQVAVGALKANVGHLDAAAGLAALIKALFVVGEGVVPPVAGFDRLNPLLEADGSPLFVPTEAMPWPGPRPRRAGVSAFGIGGTNAHVIVEQPPPLPDRPPEDGRARLVLLSAADPDALSRSAARLADSLRCEDFTLAEVSGTLAAGRAELPERLAVTGRSRAEVADRLATGAGVVRDHRPDRVAPVVFLFPGQGCQYPGMAVPLVEALPGFAGELASCLDAFEPALAARLRDALLDEDFPAAELDATELAQPALFALEYAAASSLIGLGVTPAAVLGHSLGELCAATVAGVLGLGDAVRFVTERGRAMRACPPGAMLAVACAPAEARRRVAECGRELEIAAINGPEACVLAGVPEAVERFRSRFGGRVLRGGRAFHSRLVEPAVEVLARALAGVRLGAPVVPFAANVTGAVVPAGERVGAELFVEQARRPVRFAEALAAVAEHVAGAVAVEVGPGRTLAALAEVAGVRAVPLSGGRAEEVLSAVGGLWAAGQAVDIGVLCAGGGRVRLPGYPFAGPRWLAPEAAPVESVVSSELVVSSEPAVPSEPAASSEPVASSESVASSAVVSPLASEEAEPLPDPAALLTSLWSDVLGHTDLTGDSDFFELGGDSLLIIQLARRINQTVGVTVPLRGMLAGRTLRRHTEILLDLLAHYRPTRGSLSDSCSPAGSSLPDAAKAS